MGNTQSTPLSLLTSNFKDVRARGHDLSMEIRRGKLITLCRSEWPAFDVGWPPEGTFRLPVIIVLIWSQYGIQKFLFGLSSHWAIAEQ